MELSEKELEQLEAYWEGRLPESERQALEHRLENDAAFRVSAQQLKKTIKGLEHLREQRIRQQLRDLEASLPAVEVGRKSQVVSKWVMGIAAVAAILVISWAAIELINELGPVAETPQHLSRRYFSAPGYIGQKLSVHNPVAEAYSRSDFKTVIALINKAAPERKDSLSLFFLGVAYLGNHQGHEAVFTFKAIQGSESVPVEDTDWYLALAYLESGNTPKALPLLRSLADTPNWEGKHKATALLKDLGEP